MSTNVAESSGKLFLPKTADAIFKINGNIAFIAKANTSANVTITTTQNQVKGGQSNSVIGVITSEKAVECSFETPEWQPEFLAANIGTKIKYGAQNFYIDDLTFSADATGSITLPERPANGVIQVEVGGTSWVTITVPDGSLVVDLSGYGFAENDCVKIIGLFEKTGKEISLTTDTDPSVGELTLISPIFKGTKGKVGTAQYIIPAFALAGNWTQAFSSDASYSITGTAIAVAGERCGESDTYGYYRQYIADDETLNQFNSIVATPSVVELEVSDTQALTVYGIRGELSEKSDITSAATFAVATGSETYISVSSAGEITALAEGTGTVNVSYNNGQYTTTVEVTVE